MQARELETTLRTARAWLEQLGYAVEGLEPLLGDVSPRRYFRVALERRSGILAFYPAEARAAFSRYLATTALLHAAGVRVAAVEAEAAELGLMLLEDLGGKTLYDRRGSPESELRPWLEEAARQQQLIESLERQAVARLNPPLDEALLMRELDQTWEVFFEPEGLGRAQGLGSDLDRTLRSLCRELAAAPGVPCHRDYMARNLVPLAPRARLAVLDHQDLRLGPPGYDLASLLNDSLYPSAQMVEQILGPRLPAARLRVYHGCVVQRCLKIVGTFRRFAALGSSRHLALVGPSLERALGHLALLTDLGGDQLAAPLRRRFAALLGPPV